MESKFYEDKKMLVFKITDEIDDCNVQKIRRRADYEIERYMPRKVIFNFDKVSFMDSAGIGMIIGRYKLVTMFRRNCIVNKCQTSCKENIRNVRSFTTNTNRRK